MAVDTLRLCIMLSCLMICGLRCDTLSMNNGNDKLSQSSEKDSKISDHQNDGGNKVIVDKTGINVKQEIAVDNLKSKHVSSTHENKQVLESSSDLGNGIPSGKSQPEILNPLSKMSLSSVIDSANVELDGKLEVVTDDDVVEESDTVLFEESGDPSESLVDQMKRLSNKIKESQGVNKDTIQMELRIDEDSVKNKNAKEQNVNMHKKETVFEQMQVIKDLQTDEELNEPINNKNIDLRNTDHKNDEDIQKKITTQKDENLNKQNVDEPTKESVHEQMLAIEKRVDKEKIDDFISYGNDEDFPTAEEEEKYITIDYTVPPSSDILPSKTYDHNTDHNKELNSEDKILLRDTPSLYNVKSTVHRVSQATEQIKPTAKIEVEPTKRHLTAGEIKKMRLQRNKKDSSTQNNMAPSPIKSVNIVNPTPINLLPSDTNNGVDDQEMSSVFVENSRFSATKQSEIKVESDDIESSDNKVTGTMYDTNALKEMVRKESVVDESSDKTERFKPTIGELDADDHVPVVLETIPPHDQDTQRQSQEQSLPTQDTPEEQENKIKAQQYFEEGEKLINNSYKKDFIQAYEYFQLAAGLGHIKALEYLGFGHLLGDYVELDPAKALTIFQDLSEKGGPKGQLGLGFSYSSGLAVNSSQAKALIYFTFAALGGDPLAQTVLGYRFLSGIGVESKCETALTYYRKVATTVAENTSSGSPVVQRIRLHEHTENKDNGAGSLMDDDLLQYYEFLADKGDVQAQVVLGQLYYQGGRGVPVNHERAQHYLLMAAESGNGNAVAFLGKMHSESSPVVTQDNDVAFQYFQKAADKGNPIGQCGLGAIYLYGKGVEKDYQKALKYFTQSSDQGWSDAQLHLGIMHFGGKGVRRDYKMAVKYFNLASQGGHVLAFYHLAQMHATGTGVLRNCHTAVELYKNVAERGQWSSMLMEAHELYKNGNVNEALLKYTFLAEMGYEVAQTNVAYILDNGESSMFDENETYQRALLHWTRAASQGSTVARLKMGDYHYYGYGTDSDYETAATHYRLATEQQHNAQAMFNLGYMHENGLGLKQDVHLAKRFYDMAAETSGDAYIPVSLALFKLGMFYGTEVFNKEMEGYYNFFNTLDIRYQLGPNWDIYLATFLAIVLGISVVVFRQQR